MVTFGTKRGYRCDTQRTSPLQSLRVGVQDGGRTRNTYAERLTSRVCVFPVSGSFRRKIHSCDTKDKYLIKRQ